MRFKYEKDVTLIIPYNTNQIVEWVGTYITFTVINNIQMAKKLSLLSPWLQFLSSCRASSLHLQLLLPFQTGLLEKVR